MGDGGAITTNDPDVALFATRMRYNGEDRDTGEYHDHGFTCLLDNMQAAFLDVKLRYLPQWIVRRKAIAQRYREVLSDLPDLLLPHYDDPRRDHVYQNYTLRSKQGSDFSDFMKANGVEALTQFRKPYYKHEALKLEDRGFPETEALSREVCSLFSWRLEQRVFGKWSCVTIPFTVMRIKIAMILKESAKRSIYTLILRIP